jgi:hypothetical protein
VRTTLTIDDQIAEELEELAHQGQRTFKSVVNEVLRAGLEHRRQRKTPVFREKPASMGLRREYEGKLNQIADELAAEDYAAKERRK